MRHDGGSMRLVAVEVRHRDVIVCKNNYVFDCTRHLNVVRGACVEFNATLPPCKKVVWLLVHGHKNKNKKPFLSFVPLPSSFGGFQSVAAADGLVGALGARGADAGAVVAGRPAACEIVKLRNCQTAKLSN
jgi:hypothetical protein